MKIRKFIAGIIILSVIPLAASGCGIGVGGPVGPEPEEPALAELEPMELEPPELEPMEPEPPELEPMEPETEPTELEPVEIREYEGEDLSSINDFRENSIKGPQFVNMDDYSLKITGLVTEPIDYTYDEVIDNHEQFKKVVTLDCVEGWSVTLLWEGGTGARFD